MVLKANQQEGHGRIDATADVTFVNNIIVSGGWGLALVMGEGNPGISGQLDGIRRMQVRGNVVVVGYIASYPGQSNSKCNMLSLSPLGGYGIAPRARSSDLSIEDNFFTAVDEGVSDGFQWEILYKLADTHTGLFRIRRNIWGRSLSGYTFPDNG